MALTVFRSGPSPSGDARLLSQVPFGGRRIFRQHRRRPDRAVDEIPAAVRTDAGEHRGGAVGAEGALEGTNPCFRTFRRQVAAAAFAVRFQLHHGNASNPVSLQRPLNRGLRRPRNAATPSLWSSVRLASANWSTSMWLARASSAYARRFTVSLVIATESGGCAASLAASAIAASKALPGSATSSTKPHS